MASVSPINFKMKKKTAVSVIKSVACVKRGVNQYIIQTTNVLYHFSSNRGTMPCTGTGTDTALKFTLKFDGDGCRRNFCHSFSRGLLANFINPYTYSVPRTPSTSL